jgi:hypothetical protein
VSKHLIQGRIEEFEALHHGTVRAHILNQDSHAAELGVLRMKGYWLGEREPTSSSSIGKCRACERKAMCPKTLFRQPWWLLDECLSVCFIEGHCQLDLLLTRVWALTTYLYYQIASSVVLYDLSVKSKVLVQVFLHLCVDLCCMASDGRDCHSYNEAFSFLWLNFIVAIVEPLKLHRVCCAGCNPSLALLDVTKSVLNYLTSRIIDLLLSWGLVLW